MDWSPVIEQVRDVAVGLVGLGLAWLAAAAASYVRAQVAALRNEELRAFIMDAVAAAEKQFGKEAKAGPAKLDYVTAVLGERGVDVEAAGVRALVESAVYDLSQ